MAWFYKLWDEVNFEARPGCWTPQKKGSIIATLNSFVQVVPNAERHDEETELLAKEQQQVHRSQKQYIIDVTVS